MSKLPTTPREYLSQQGYRLVDHTPFFTDPSDGSKDRYLVFRKHGVIKAKKFLESKIDIKFEN